MSKKSKKSISAESNKLITQFFSKSQNENEYNIIGNVVETNTQNKCQIMEFYEVATDNRVILEPSCNSSSCVDQKYRFKQKLASLKFEIEKIKRAQAMATEICNEKDKKIRFLESTVPNDVVANQDDSKLTQNKPTKSAADESIRYEKFLTADQMMKIQTIGPFEKADSTFILNIVRSLYSSDLRELANVTLKGCGRNGQKKVMCPEKKQIITQMFSNRLQNCAEEEQRNRMKNMNSLIQRAITNIITSSKNKIQITDAQN